MWSWAPLSCDDMDSVGCVNLKPSEGQLEAFVLLRTYKQSKVCSAFSGIKACILMQTINPVAQISAFES